MGNGEWRNDGSDDPAWGTKAAEKGEKVGWVCGCNRVGANFWLCCK